MHWSLCTFYITLPAHPKPRRKTQMLSRPLQLTSQYPGSRLGLGLGLSVFGLVDSSGALEERWREGEGAKHFAVWGVGI